MSLEFSLGHKRWLQQACVQRVANSKRTAQLKTWSSGNAEKEELEGIASKTRYVQVPRYDCLKKVGIRPGEGDSLEARSSRQKQHHWYERWPMTLRSECFFYANECVWHLSNFIANPPLSATAAAAWVHVSFTRMVWMHRGPQMARRKGQCTNPRGLVQGPRKLYKFVSIPILLLKLF